MCSLVELLVPILSDLARKACIVLGLHKSAIVTTYSSIVSGVWIERDGCRGLTVSLWCGFDESSSLERLRIATELKSPRKPCSRVRDRRRSPTSMPRAI